MTEKGLRVLTYNIHKGFNAGNRRFVLHQIRDALIAADADLMFLQEMQGEHLHHQEKIADWPVLSQLEFLAENVWPYHAYGKNAIYNAGHHGNAILSKHPFEHWENINVSPFPWASRSLLHAVIRLPRMAAETFPDSLRHSQPPCRSEVSQAVRLPGMQDDCMDAGGTTPRMGDDCTDAGGTTPRMGDDCTDAGGRATQGAVAEVESRPERRSRAPTVGALGDAGAVAEVEQRRSSCRGNRCDRLPKSNQNVHIICIHFGLTGKERRLQIGKLSTRIDSHVPPDAPLIIAGDFNDWLGQADRFFHDHLGLQEVFRETYGRYARSFPAWLPFLPMDRIYYRGLIPVSCERLAYAPWHALSDHAPLTASFML